MLTSSTIFTGIKAPARDYSIPGSSTSKIFTTIGAAANLVFAFNTGMLPEIQVGQKFDIMDFNKLGYLPRDAFL